MKSFAELFESDSNFKVGDIVLLVSDRFSKFKIDAVKDDVYLVSSAIKSTFNDIVPRYGIAKGGTLEIYKQTLRGVKFNNYYIVKWDEVLFKKYKEIHKMYDIEPAVAKMGFAMMVYKSMYLPFEEMKKAIEYFYDGGKKYL